MLKKAAARVAGTAEPGVAPSVACGVAAAFTGQLVAFPLEAIARRMQARPTLSGFERLWGPPSLPEAPARHRQARPTLPGLQR